MINDPEIVGNDPMLVMTPNWNYCISTTSNGSSTYSTQSTLKQGAGRRERRVLEHFVPVVTKMVLQYPVQVIELGVLIRST